MERVTASFEDLSRGQAGAWLARLGRMGYYTKGVVYGVIGLLAFRAAIGAAGSTEGPRGAILEIAGEPFGQILLAIIAIGLFGYAVWRFVEAGLDVSDAGTDASGIVKRLGYAASGFSYVGLALWAAAIVVGTGSRSDDGDSQQEWTAALMSQPLGQWLVGLVGLIVVGVGLFHFSQVLRASFMKRYRRGEMSASQRTWARRLGRLGLAARGVTFGLIGTFMIHAAVQSDPSEAKGLGDALQTLAHQTYGPWLLGAVALGFVAYGAYSVSRGRFGQFAGR